MKNGIPVNPVIPVNSNLNMQQTYQTHRQTYPTHSQQQQTYQTHPTEHYTEQKHQSHVHHAPTTPTVFHGFMPSNVHPTHTTLPTYIPPQFMSTQPREHTSHSHCSRHSRRERKRRYSRSRSPSSDQSTSRSRSRSRSRSDKRSSRRTRRHRNKDREYEDKIDELEQTLKEKEKEIKHWQTQNNQLRERLQNAQRNHDIALIKYSDENNQLRQRLKGMEANSDKDGWMDDAQKRVKVLQSEIKARKKLRKADKGDHSKTGKTGKKKTKHSKKKKKRAMPVNVMKQITKNWNNGKVMCYDDKYETKTEFLVPMGSKFYSASTIARKFDATSLTRLLLLTDIGIIQTREVGRQNKKKKTISLPTNVKANSKWLAMNGCSSEKFMNHFFKSISDAADSLSKSKKGELTVEEKKLAMKKLIQFKKINKIDYEFVPAKHAQEQEEEAPAKSESDSDSDSESESESEGEGKEK